MERFAKSVNGFPRTKKHLQPSFFCKVFSLIRDPFAIIFDVFYESFLNSLDFVEELFNCSRNSQKMFVKNAGENEDFKLLKLRNIPFVLQVKITF